MSRCQRCSACKIRIDIELDEGFAYCLESMRILFECDGYIISNYNKIPCQLINSDADTPEWCPLEVKV